MGFRKRNAKKSDNKAKSAVIMGKPASQLTKEEKKILSARMAEIKQQNGSNATVQNTIPFQCMYRDGVCQVSENFFSYWYDGTGGTKRDTEVYLTNVVLTDGLKVGDTIRTGEYFANVTNYQHCDNLENTGENYIHLKIKIDTDGFGWKFIDPRLVLY